VDAREIAIDEVGAGAGLDLAAVDDLVDARTVLTRDLVGVAVYQDDIRPAGAVEGQGAGFAGDGGGGGALQ
jgi:hypothetical protein